MSSLRWRWYLNTPACPSTSERLRPTTCTSVPAKGTQTFLIFHNGFNKHSFFFFLFSLNLKVNKVLARNQSQTIRRMHTVQIIGVRAVTDGKRTVWLGTAALLNILPPNIFLFHCSIPVRRNYTEPQWSIGTLGNSTGNRKKFYKNEFYKVLFLLALRENEGMQIERRQTGKMIWHLIMWIPELLRRRQSVYVYPACVLDHREDEVCM